MIDVLRLVNARGRAPARPPPWVVDSRWETRHLLACYHVLFGARREGRAIRLWAASAPMHASSRPWRRTIRGQLGRVTFRRRSLVRRRAQNRRIAGDRATGARRGCRSADARSPASATQTSGNARDESAAPRQRAHARHGRRKSITSSSRISTATRIQAVRASCACQGDDPDVGFSVAGDSGRGDPRHRRPARRVACGARTRLGDGIGAPIAPLLDSPRLSRVCGWLCAMRR